MTNLPKTSDLLNTSQLAAEFKLDHKKCQSFLDDGGVKAEATFPYGRGHLRLYAQGPARDAIRARMPKPAAAPTPQPAAPSVDLGVLEERVEALTEAVKAVQEQNRALFAYLRDHVGDPVGQLVSELSGVKQ